MGHGIVAGMAVENNGGGAEEVMWWVSFPDSSTSFGLSTVKVEKGSEGTGELSLPGGVVRGIH